MASVRITTRVDEETARGFKETCKALGTTPSNALRMFVAAFVACGGFPFDVPWQAARDSEEAPRV